MFLPLTTNNLHDCHATNRDGFDDLLVFFNRTHILEALGDLEDEQTLVLRLTGNLKTEYGGYPIVGEDLVVIKIAILGQNNENERVLFD